MRTFAESCDSVTLQWTQPSVPNDITTSVSCTPPSPGCAECTTSPCTITGHNPSTEYEFTVTLNSGGCRASMSTTARTMGEIKTSVSWVQNIMFSAGHIKLWYNIDKFNQFHLHLSIKVQFVNE